MGNEIGRDESERAETARWKRVDEGELTREIIAAFYMFYLGERAGRFRLDLVVEGKVIVECKATELLLPGARPQVFNYLRCSSLPVALLLHFGPTPKHHRFVVTKSLGQR